MLASTMRRSFLAHRLGLPRGVRRWGNRHVPAFDQRRPPRRAHRAVGSGRSSTRPARPTCCSASSRAAASSLPAFLATQAPIFTPLRRRDGASSATRPRIRCRRSAPSSRTGPFRTARLTEEQIQGVLEDALGTGGLGAARTDYRNDQIADAPTAVFTINAGGLSKTVSIYALGIDVQQGGRCARSGGVPEAGRAPPGLRPRRRVLDERVRARTLSRDPDGRRTRRARTPSRGRGPTSTPADFVPNPIPTRSSFRRGS